MPRRGENIYRRKDGRWEGRYVTGRTEAGRTRYGYIYGRQYREVREKLAVVKAALYTGKPVCQPIFGDGTLEVWLDHWLYTHMKPQVKESTLQLYARLIDKHIRPALGCMRLAAMRDEHIRSFEESLLKTLSASTTGGVMRLVKAALKLAQYRGFLEKNPFDAFRIAKGTRKKPRVLNVAEQERLEKAVVQTGDMEYLLMLYTGLRLGEVCALTWEDIDLNAGKLTVRRTVQRVRGQGQKKTRLRVDRPKSDCSEREIPLPAFLVEMLGQMREQSASAFVFSGAHGNMRDPRTVQGRFARLAQKLGIQGAHVHTLRHTFATRCLEKRIGYETLARLMGHSSPRITMDYYAHSTWDTTRKSMARLRLLAS